jgi:hypothetical protein
MVLGNTNGTGIARLRKELSHPFGTYSYSSIRCCSSRPNHASCNFPDQSIVVSLPKPAIATNGYEKCESAKTLVKGMTYHELEAWVQSLGYRAGQAMMLTSTMIAYELAAYEHDDFKQVKMASGEKQAVGPSVDNCIVDLGVCTTRLKVYVTALGVYDLIIGMDWLAAHRAMVDCFAKRVLCVNDEGRPVEIQGVQRKVSLRFISTMKVKRCLRQGCRLYVVEAVNERKGPSLDQYPVFS